MSLSAASCSEELSIHDHSQTDFYEECQRSVGHGISFGYIFSSSLPALDTGYELACMTQPVAEPGPTSIRSATVAGLHQDPACGG